MKAPLNLVEGEELLSVHVPHPLAVAPLYAPAAFLLALSVTFNFVFSSGPWASFVGRDDYPTSFAIAAALVVFTLLLSGYAAMRLGKRRAWALGAGACAIGVALVSPIFGIATGYGAALSASLAIAAIAATAVAEVARRAERCTITNVRLVFSRGFLTREERSIRLHRIADVETRRTPLLGMGTLIVHLDSVQEEIAHGVPTRLRGVRRFQRTRDEILSLTRSAPPPEYLGDKSDAVKRIDSLLRPSEIAPEARATEKK